MEAKLELEALHEELRKAKTQRNQLAHDLRGPVGGILSLAVSTENVSLDEDEFKTYMEMIKGSASKLLDLTDDILERAKQHSRENYFTLPELKTHLEEFYALSAHNKDIDFEVIFNQAKDNRRFPRKKLLPIAGNLISNAIKFTPSKGCIKVNLDIVQKQEAVNLFIEVQDNGKGIQKNRLENLRSLGLEEDRGTADEKGYGLGLRLVAEMVESIDGNLNIDSEVGKGTNVEIIVPLGRD
ncbi:MAG: HAMP domain-containing histidine kinase [Muricauda sp.]|nr:HAMP domain-containing sensor histidine kinase [Allomuricauda sp.]MBA4746877.1 HAMP domain-containing histidine kinase [Allomuricauda sp.]